jgi:glycoside hydrolase-like protein
MEGYTRTTTNTAAVLAFLEAWTSQLHAHGYVSGVYGSALSTISDLTLQYGSGYGEPENIWIARWNGQQSTEDTAVPPTYWSNHQRIHQYQGGHNERYGGVTVNIDSDYIDAAVVGTASAPVVPVKRHCSGVVLSRRAHSAARKINTVNLVSCARAQRVAKGSRPRRFAAPGGDRFYRKRAFTCHGHTVGRARVLYSCTKGRTLVKFARNGLR